MDIPKDMLEFRDIQVPKENSRYMVTSLAKYDDMEPLKKLVKEIFTEMNKRG